MHDYNRLTPLTSRVRLKTVLSRRQRQTRYFTGAVNTARPSQSHGRPHTSKETKRRKQNTLLDKRLVENKRSRAPHENQHLAWSRYKHLFSISPSEAESLAVLMLAFDLAEGLSLIKQFFCAANAAVSLAPPGTKIGASAENCKAPGTNSKAVADKLEVVMCSSSACVVASIS